MEVELRMIRQQKQHSQHDDGEEASGPPKSSDAYSHILTPNAESKVDMAIIERIKSMRSKSRDLQQPTPTNSALTEALL
jgi:hypothetical protein